MVIRKDKFVCIRLGGGIGNQLFMFAYGKAISLKTNRILIIDRKSGYLFDKYRRKPKIDRLVAPIRWATATDLIRFYLTKYFPALANTLLGSLFILERNPSIILDDYMVENKTACKYLFIQGYFQSYTYHAGYENQIKGSLKFSDFNNVLINIFWGDFP